MQKSNVAELVLNDEVKRLLALCAPERAHVSSNGSDYDRFLHFCHCLPLFYGHPLQSSVQQYFKQYFASDLPITPQNAAKLWHLTADQLMRSDASVPNFSITETTDVTTLPPLSAGETYTAFAANVLSQTDARTWREWQEEMRVRLDRIVLQNPTRIIRFDLNEHISTQRPSLYHVEKVLQKECRKREDYDILSAQVLRFVCEYTKGKALRINIHVNTPHVAGFLEHLEKNVGLPPMVCVAHDERTQDAIIKLIPSVSAPIRLGLVYHDFLSHYHFEHAVLTIAKKYPMGYLTVFENNRQKHFIIP